MEAGAIIPTIIAYVFLSGYVAVILNLILTMMDENERWKRK